MKQFLVKYVITVTYAEEHVFRATDKEMAIDIFESFADHRPERLTDNKHLAKILAKGNFGVEIEADWVEEVTNG